MLFRRKKRVGEVVRTASIATLLVFALSRAQRRWANLHGGSRSKGRWARGRAAAGAMMERSAPYRPPEIPNQGIRPPDSVDTTAARTLGNDPPGWLPT